MLFGALLDKAGAGNYFIKMAFAALGHLKGGPAKAAVVGSAAIPGVFLWINVHWLVGLLAGALTFWGLVHWLKRHPRIRWSVVAATSIDFAKCLRKGAASELAGMIDQWAGAIAETLDAENSDCLLLAHSYGAILSPTLLSGISQRTAKADRMISIHMGSILPLALSTRRDDRYTRHVNEVMSDPAGAHIEIFSACDTLNFPYHTEAWAAHPRFHQWDVDFFGRGGLWMFHPRRLRSFENHFRYLRSQDAYSDYDFFDLLFSPSVLRYCEAPDP